MRPDTDKNTAFVSGPGWAFYTFGTAAWTLVTLPAVAAQYAIPSLRPHPKWSFSTSIMTYISRIALTWIGVTETPTAQMTSVKPGLGDFVSLEPGDSKLYGDAILNDNEIQPRPVGAVWVPTAPAETTKKHVVLHFHGGAYVAFSPSDDGFQTAARILTSKLGDTSALLVDYRMACNAGGRHPAALQDAITAYKSLLDRGFSPGQIVVTGDSAGAHLTLMLLRHISDHKTLPAPANAGLFSPWVDMTGPLHEALAGPLNEALAGPNKARDYLTKDLLIWAHRTFVPRNLSVDTPYMSPARHPFHTPTKLFFQSSQVELMQPQQLRAKQAFESVVGNQVQYFEVTHSPHDIFALGKDLRQEEEQAKIIEAAVAFFTK